jgi:hypothetical protein
MCFSTHFLCNTNDKWWPQCQEGKSKRKTVVGIAATTSLWIEHMEYYQYRPGLSFNMLIVIIHVLLHSFIFFYIINDKLWPQECQLGTSKLKTVVGIVATTSFWMQHMEYSQYRPALTFDILPVNHTCASSLIFIFYITNDKWWPHAIN